MCKAHLGRSWLLVLALLLLTSAISSCSPSTAPQYPYSEADNSQHRTELVQSPNPPSGLIGESVSQSIVTLQWLDNSNNEDGFNIYRDGNKIATVTNTVYQDAELKPGQTYQYIVKAFNSAGESAGSSCSARTLNPPLNVTINHIGIKFDHDPSEFWQGPGDIRLIALITDGKQTVQELLPPGESNFPLNDYQTVQLDQRVFHTPEAGDYLKIVLIAYDDDPESLVSDLVQAALPVLGPILGVPYASEISTIFAQYQEKTGKPLFENKDDYVGYFAGFWGSDQAWGIGQYQAVGTEDFRVWLSIWSDTEPPPIPKPTLMPNVTIQSVDVPAEVEVGRYYEYKVTLMNDESRSVTVTLNVKSSVTGEVSSQSVTLPATGISTIRQETKFEPAGVRTVTYSILYRNQQIASVTRTINATTRTLVTPTPTATQKPLSVNFDGWYVDGVEVSTVAKGKTVTARIVVTGGSAGQITMRIRRDISWGSDQTVKQLSFNHNGISTIMELSFVPPYATGEASTNGYHIDLQKGGYEIWTLVNNYPPRLRVTTS